MARADAKYSVTLEDKTQRALRSIQGNLGRVQSGFSALGKAAGVLGGVGGGGFLLLTKRTLDNADAMIKQADATGLSSDAFQEYSDALSFAGISQETFNTATVAFVKRVGEARNGVGPLVSGLKGLNQELLDGILAARNQDEALDLVFQAMGNAATAADRARIANAAFSRTGVTLARAVKDGAEGLQELRRQARESGRVIEEGLLRNAEAANDAMARLQRTIGANMSRALLQNAAAIESIGNRIAESLPSMIQFVDRLLVGIGAIEASPFQQAAEDIGDVESRMIGVNRQLSDLIAQADLLRANGGSPFAIAQVEGQIERLRAQAEALSAVYQRLHQTVGQSTTMDVTVSGGNVATIQDPAAAERERQFAITQAIHEGVLERMSIAKMWTDYEQGQAQQRVAAEQAATQAMTNLRGTMVSELSGFFSVMASESKDWARAAVILNRGLAIAQIAQDTEIAAMKAYASQLIPGDPSSEARASAAYGRAKSLGRVSMALAAATGLAQLSQINSGGGGGGSGSNAGSAANPISTVPALGSQPQGTANQLTIVIDTGGSGLAVMSERQLDDIIVDAVQRADDRGVTIIRPNGSNAQAVRSGF